MRSSFRSLSAAARLAAAAAAVAAITVPASAASAAGYPPAPSPTLSANPGTVVVNTEFEATGGGFTAGPVTVVIEGTDISVETEAFAPSGFHPAAAAVGAGFVVTMPAPGTPGPYTLTATDSVGGTASASIMVTQAGTQPPAGGGSGELPRTGSNSSGLIAAGAAGLLGAGAVVVAISRRRAAA